VDSPRSAQQRRRWERHCHCHCWVKVRNALKLWMLLAIRHRVRARRRLWVAPAKATRPAVVGIATRRVETLDSTLI
jgi:hypothetical protein